MPQTGEAVRAYIGTAVRTHRVDWSFRLRAAPDSGRWIARARERVQMRIFGSTAHIAVQVELLEPAGEFPVCHICLWADGMRIGDYQQAVLLSPIADFFRSTIGSHDRRIDDELGGLSPEQILAAVKTVLFDDAGSELPYDETRLRRLQRYRNLCIAAPAARNRFSLAL